MSEPSPALEDTSPVSSVRSSEAPAENHHVSGTASSSKSKEIKSTTSARPNGLGSKENGLDENPKDIQQPSYPINGHVGGHVDVGSDPNTPRLPPTRKGNSDLENIPQEATTSLNSSRDCASDLPPSSTIFSKYTFSLSQAPISTFSSSVSEPGSLVAEDSQIIPQQRQNPSRLQDKTKVTSWLEKSQQSDTVPKPAILLRTSRTKSHQNPIHPQMSGIPRPEAAQTLGMIDRSARGEAFSEKRNRSSSRSSQSRVEKRIEATLADAEPPSHARSRKSSHTFGLFKETNASQGFSGGRYKSRTTSGSAIDSFMTTGSSLNHDIRHDVGRLGQRGQSTSGDKKHDGEATEESLSTSEKHKEDGIKGSSEPPDSRQALQPSPAPSSRVEYATKERSEPDISTDDPTDQVIHLSLNTSEVSKKKVPDRLLEEIRNHHNLTAPLNDKFKSAQYKPPWPHVDKDEVEALLGSQERPQTEQDDLNEDETSEHISSILYNPHQAPSPDALEDVSINNARSSKEASFESDAQLPDPALGPGDGNEIAEDVGIALQVHNRNSYFHGDLSKARPPSVELERKQASISGFSSASDSDYESQDENRPPGIDEDSSLADDAEATPRASPNTRKSYLASRSRKIRRGPRAPLGAVELKPFNHQVGGHTNLFSFSKRAVCKQLSNRENEFYEVVERQHPELLKFLPRYDPSPFCIFPLCIILAMSRSQNLACITGLITNPSVDKLLDT